MTTPPTIPSHPSDPAEDRPGSEPPTRPDGPPQAQSPTHPWWLPSGAPSAPPQLGHDMAAGWAAPAAPAAGQSASIFARPRAKLGAIAAAALVVGAAAGAGITAAAFGGQRDTASSATSQLGSTSGSGTSGAGTGRSDTGPSSQLPQGRFPGSTGGDPGAGSVPGTSSSVVKASTAQQVGVVDIDTVDRYDGAEAAGTGVVISGSGEVLTNNHVIDGATKITVKVVSSGRSYTARVVGTSPSNDIAVLKLVGASGLRTARLGDSSTVTVGQSVTGVGNAGGTGGTPRAARGTVTALHKTITASGEDGSGAETLTGVIVTDAPIQSGDSGGPLYNSSNQVIGIDTAAASGIGASAGYAIPIDKALMIAHRIESGPASATIHLGYPAFLGVGLSPNATRPVVTHVYRGGAAAKAGLVAGDIITKVNATPIATYAQLHRAIAVFAPGDTISVTVTRASGASKTVRVVLATGPAD